jgi:hypothetical protein
VLWGVSPLVWRRLLLASDTSIAELHEILKSAFDWSGEHLHRFLIHGSTYGIRCPGGLIFQEDARRVALSRSGLRCGERFRHEYDFTADWTLDIRLEKALPLIQIGLFRYASAEAELRRPKTALEPGIIKSASIVTSISCPSKNSELWLRRCGDFLIPMATATPLAISTNCAKLSIG